DGRQDARFARRRGRGQVFIEKRCLRSRAAPVRQGGDPDDLLAARQGDPHEISRTEGARRLDGLVVHVHLAAVACRGCERPALEEPRGPQPLVDSQIRHDALTVTQAVGYTRRGDSSSRPAAHITKGRGETMRRGTILAVVLLAASTVWGQGAQLVVEDWSKTPMGQKGIPNGWKAQNWGSPSYDFEVVGDGSVHRLHLKSNGDSSTINKEIKVDCKDYQILQWSWKVVELPKGADARKKATDDEAAQIYVTFPRFPSAVRSRIIGYIWDTTA